jgi:hypothetical protein
VAGLFNEAAESNVNTMQGLLFDFLNNHDASAEVKD